MPQSRFERVVPCNMLLWPDHGWPASTFTYPTPSQAAKPPKPIPIRAWDVSSVRSILVNNPTHFYSQALGFACVRVGKLKPLGESSGLKLARRAVEGRKGRYLASRGATVLLGVGRQASELERPAPSMLRGLSAAHRRWAACAMRVGYPDF